MNARDYAFVRRLIKARAGIAIAADKSYLIESRLLPLARKVGLASLADLITALNGPAAEPLIVQVVEAMTTNETSFFRDRTPFDQFRDTIVPALMVARARSRHLRIWCAAASSGQEPYSLAMSLAEMAGDVIGWGIDILATDLSRDVLARAEAGIYTQFEVQRGLPIQMLLKYFGQVGDRWQISASLRSMMRFRPFNLLDDPAPLGVFDLVFCRNVLIYFDPETKSAVLDRLARAVAPDGFLVLGAAETVLGLTDRFQPFADNHGLYVRAGGEARVQATRPAPRLSLVGSA